MDVFIEILPYLIPLVIIELSIRVYTIVDITKLKKNGIKTRWFSDVVWIIIVAVVNFAWLVYFLFGKEE